MLCPWETAREVRRRAMSTQRKQSSAEFKARVALEALKGLKTVNELASTSGVHPTQIAHWKHRLQKEMPDSFSARRAKREHDQSGGRTSERLSFGLEALSLSSSIRQQKT